ncbi:MAG: autotransporter domain-containing protein, partial [Nitrospinota bacterium]|nr:autotransporter domain-containing protein [Nitrospinota bacterium]
DHGKAGEDHGKAGEDHGKAGEDHGKAGEDHGKAGEDHGKAGEDHGKAGEDHGKAGEDHGKAGDGRKDDDRENNDERFGRGTVTVTSNGDIVTRGLKSHAIIAQSLSDNPSDSTGSFSAGSGETGNKLGGDVHVFHTGTIQTEGEQSHGIVAQSRGRSGGVVNVNVLGDVIANGANADGIVVESLGSKGNGGNIIVILEGGRVQGGPDSGVGVRFSGGADNLLANRGTLTTLNGTSGTAVVGDSGNETIENYGTLVGEVDLGLGNNALNNQEGAVFHSGPRIYLGNGNKMVNAGSLSPGGSNQLVTTTVTGDFEQSKNGTLAVDVNFAKGQADRVMVNGTASLAGEVQPNPVFENGIVPGKFQTTVLSATEGVTDFGLDLSFQKSAVIDYQLIFPNNNEVVLNSVLDFSPSGLNSNQTSIGNYINNIQMAGGSSGLAPLVASLLGAPDVSSLGAIYDQLTPEIFVNQQIIFLLSNQNLNNSLRSCRQYSGVFHFSREGECKWLRFTGRTLRSDRTSENLGFAERAFGMAGGIQKAISEHYHMGFGMSFEGSDLDSGNSQARGQQLQGGMVLKGRYGATSFNLGISGGYSWYDTKRMFSFPSPGGLALSDQGVSLVSAQSGLAYILEGSNWYFKPMLNTEIAYVNLGSFQETGAGATNLNVEGNDELYWSIQPAMEFGGEWNYEENYLMRPFIRVGYTRFIGDANPEISATLQGAPVGVAPFQVTGRTERNFADIETGVDLLSPKNFTLRFYYIGKFSNDVQIHQGGFKVSASF